MGPSATAWTIFRCSRITLAVGLVVDDAIVVLENIVRHVENGMPPLQAALRGSKEIGFTIISISVSLVAVFIPIFFMPGVIGLLFHEFAAIVGLAVLVSAVVSLTLIPMLASRYLAARGAQEAAAGAGRHGSSAASTASLALYDAHARLGLAAPPHGARHRARAPSSPPPRCSAVIPKGFFPE